MRIFIPINKEDSDRIILENKEIHGFLKILLSAESACAICQCYAHPGSPVDIP